MPRMAFALSRRLMGTLVIFGRLTPELKMDLPASAEPGPNGFSFSMQGSGFSMQGSNNKLWMQSRLCRKQAWLSCALKSSQQGLVN